MPSCREARGAQERGIGAPRPLCSAATVQSLPGREIHSLQRGWSRGGPGDPAGSSGEQRAEEPRSHLPPSRPPLPPQRNATQRRTEEPRSHLPPSRPQPPPQRSAPPQPAPPQAPGPGGGIRSSTAKSPPGAEGESTAVPNPLLPPGQVRGDIRKGDPAGPLAGWICRSVGVKLLAGVMRPDAAGGALSIHRGRRRVAVHPQRCAPTPASDMAGSRTPILTGGVLWGDQSQRILDGGCS